ncbi:MAG TPA: TraB/GumN family protein [Methylibium sp.]|uniref:TraB/GumN family protein n=1 Tax=Methylibium sp. TaxID=2067992 RepID=UPI002DB59940|nr:TraB/GumN family protein [Methylibium sp.]HEU4460343.1 TraB/GumN family protein [Methylibium sp.]
MPIDACWPRLRARLLALALTLGGALAAAADCPPPTPTPSAAQMQAAQAGARDRGFLWRIEQGGRSSWLYGTLHVAKLEWAFPGPQVLAALSAARLVALELDPTDLDAARAALAALAPGDAGSAERLPPALARRLAHRIDAECLSHAAFDALSPTMQAITLATLVARRDGLDPAFGIDAMLAGFAHAGGRPVVALESFEQQLAALTGGRPDEAQRFVEQTLDEIDSGRARTQAARLAQAWADGDLATLESYPRWCGCMESAEERALMERLIDDRNLAMAARIDALHREGGAVFAAVGALHLSGPQGLPALLAARGYRVERVTFGR